MGEKSLALVGLDFTGWFMAMNLSDAGYLFSAYAPLYTSRLPTEVVEAKILNFSGSPVLGDPSAEENKARSPGVSCGAHDFNKTTFHGRGHKPTRSTKG